MNKKGSLMLSIIIVLVLTFLVFYPTILFASKLISVKDQTRDSFTELVNEINQISLGKQDNGKVMLKMDSKTAIVGFTANQFENCIGNDCEIWEKPKVPNCQEGSCVCLISDFVPFYERNQVFPRKPSYKTVSCLKTKQKTFSTHKTIVGNKENPLKLSWKNGFLIANNINKAVYFSRPLVVEGVRLPLYLNKKNEGIYLCLDDNCKDMDLTFKEKKQDIATIKFS